VTDGILHRIDRVEPRPGYRLRITWSNGVQADVDFSRDVRDGGVWTELRDEGLFRQARVTYDGTVLEWPQPVRANGEPKVDIDADGLWEMAAAQDVSEASLQSARK
jgi:hypothetical protein